MSGVSVVVNLLLANATLLASVPAARIMAGEIPDNATFPCISVQQISAVQRKTVSMAESVRYCTDRVQITVMAKTYLAAKQIMALVRSALPVSTGATVAGIAVQSVLHEGEGPDFIDEQRDIYAQQVDYMVSFNR